MGLFDFFKRKDQPRQHVEALVQAMRRQNPSAGYTLQSDGVTIEGLEGQQINLENVLQEVDISSKEERDDLATRLASLGEDPIPDTFEDARPLLLPRLRARADSSLSALSTGIRAAGIPLADHLRLDLALDFPTSSVQVLPSTLDSWGVPIEDAMEIAVGNLQERLDESLSALVIGGLHTFDWDDFNEASLVSIIDHFLPTMKLEGDPVVATPDRGTLLVTGSKDREGLQMMGQKCLERVQGPRWISGIPIVLRNDGWRPFRAGRDLEALYHLRTHTLLQEHGQQQQALNQHHEKLGRDVFVATLSAVERKRDQEVLTYAIWSEGVEALLPRADRIGFVRPHKEEMLGFARFEDVLTVMESRMLRETDLYPERWFVDGFPSQSQLAALKPSPEI